MRLIWSSRTHDRHAGPDNQPRVGTEIGSHQLLEVIGVGASAVVYRARHRSTAAESAFKVWGVPSSPAVRVQFLRECRIHWALSGHPNIARLFTASSPDAPVLWSSQELLPESLTERLARAPGWDRSQALFMSVQLLQAVEAIHLAGVLHRDINPANILVQGHRLAVTDFGAADYLQHPRQDAAAGTPRFVAPELLRGARPGPSTDLFSAALTIREMLGSYLSGDIARVLRTAGSPNPEDRRISVARVRATLEAALKREPPPRWPAPGSRISRLRSLAGDRVDGHEQAATPEV